MDISFNPPHIYDAVLRQRLFSLFDENTHTQNILVMGQAAQGKSTLVASYLKNKKHSILWFQLSGQDDKHTILYEKLALGLAMVNDAPDKSGISVISHASGGPGTAETMLIPRSTLGAQKGELRHFEALSVFLTELETPVTIVFDNLQTIDESSSGFLLIKNLVDLKFEKLKLILVSRTLPAFDLARLKMDRHLFIVDNETLAFTLDETRTYFAEKSTACSIDIEKTHQITEGWAGGLTLVSESIRHFKDRPHLPDKLSAEVFDFFSQEIYSRLDESTRDFLITISVLETIELGAVNHLVGRPDGIKILKNLEKRNLFIQRLDSGFHTGSPKFQFHDLFRNFLLQDLRTQKGENGVKTLNYKAGQFFWNKKNHQQAVTYFIHAQSFLDIVRIIRVKGTDYIIKGKMAEPERWISHLPKSLIANDPWLLFFQTMTQRIKGGKKNITQLQKAFTLFEQSNEDRGVLLCIGFLIEASVFIRLPSPKILEWIGKGEKMLKKVQASHRYPWARALLWQQIGLGYIAGDGNIPKGISACKNAILLGNQIHNQELIINASIIMTFGHVQAGDFARARKMLTKIEHMTYSGRHPEYRALKGIVDIDLALKNGDFHIAENLLGRSEKDIEKFGLIFLYPAFVEEKAYHLVYTSRYDEARQMADHLNDFSILEGNDFYSGISHRIKALTDLYQRHYKSSLNQIKQAVTKLDKAKKGDIHHFLAIQLKGIILFSNTHYQKAAKTLLPALNYFRKISSDLSASETAIALGLIFWARGKEKQGFEYLSKGFEKICQKKYTFFPLLDNQMIARAILQFAAKGLPGTMNNHILSLISQCGAQPVFDQMNKIMYGLKKNEKLKVKEKFRPLYKKLLPKIQILSLGQFSVQIRNQDQHRTILAERSRPVLLLKSIVLHGARDIPKEILIDNLWPDADAESGEKNFKINLFRLRKTIEPEYEKEFGYSYIVQKSGLISLDPELIHIDVDAFMAISNNAFKKEKDSLFEPALELYDQAIQLYKGDYFAEEPYMEWILRKRDLFRAQFMEILQKKAMLHEELDQITQAIDAWRTLLQTDPCFETAYQNLMILYADSGQKNMAQDMFEDCKTFLDKELGAKPDSQTMQIYDRIRLYMK
ncbi:MAG: protein MalT [Desulfobacula sp.]|nr:protein MalT [Desulfobacula sp.]